MNTIVYWLVQLTPKSYTDLHNRSSRKSTCGKLQCFHTVYISNVYIAYTKSL